MSTPEQLAIPEAQAALATIEPPPVAQMIQSLIEKGVTGETVTVMERLVTLYEHMEVRNAEKQFNEAFVRLQQELPVIVAQTVIPNRGKYERFEDVMAKVGPVLTKHGFSVSFSQDVSESRIIETCHLRHVGGHSQANSFAVRTGKADTETQADCKAATTAKRNALLNALNIVIRQDVLSGEEGEDASLEGAFIDSVRVQYLKEQLADTGGSLEKLLEMAGAAKLEEVTNGVYPVLVRSIEMKKKAKR
jgi:hypothetical protein